jgi:DNA polymerase-3 subunit beta
VKITIAQQELLPALQTLQAIAPQRNTLPILANVLLDANDGAITVAATDLEVGARVRVNGAVHQTGAVTCPVRTLADLVRQLPESDLQFEVGANNQVHLECGRNSYRLFGLPAEEFPAMVTPGQELFTLDAGIIRKMVERTRFAAATEEHQYFLNGVYLHVSAQWLRMVATDTRRLALVTHPAEGLVEKEIGVILPIKAVEELLRAFSKAQELRVGIRENLAVFWTDDSVLSSRLVDAEYPEYERYIPKENAIHLTVECAPLLSALRRVSLFAPKTLSVSLEVTEDVVALHASSPEFGEAREEIAATCTEAIRIGFNAKFLMDALSVVEAQSARLEMRDPVSAAVLRPDEENGYLCLIMPQRLE